jgi:hypothetical protein
MRADDRNARDEPDCQPRPRAGSPPGGLRGRHSPFCPPSGAGKDALPLQRGPSDRHDRGSSDLPLRLDPAQEQQDEHDEQHHAQ